MFEERNNTPAMSHLYKVDADAYLALLQPWNLYNQTYTPATVHFDNGVIRESLQNVGMKVKGATSRLKMKKVE